MLELGGSSPKVLQRQARLMLLMRGISGPLAIKANTGAADACDAPGGWPDFNRSQKLAQLMLVMPFGWCDAWVSGCAAVVKSLQSSDGPAVRKGNVFVMFDLGPHLQHRPLYCEASRTAAAREDGRV